MAPPTVTRRVPGVTGTNQPERDAAAIRVVEAHPATHGDPARVEVDPVDGVQPGGVEHGASGVLGRVPVAPAQAPGDDARPPFPGTAASPTA